jgi:hypothetical protein
VKYAGDGKFYTYGGNCSMGQLLPRGLEMSELNGRHLRQAYGSFIPSSYLADPSKVFLQSDNSDRVIASGNAVFRAIFKDDMSASYSSDALPVVDWFVPDKSPMNPGDFCTEELAVSSPRFSCTRQHGIVLFARVRPSCPVTRHLQTLLHAAQNSSEYKEKQKQYNATIQRLGKTFGCGGRSQTYSFSVFFLPHFRPCCSLAARSCSSAPQIPRAYGLRRPSTAL